MLDNMSEGKIPNGLKQEGMVKALLGRSVIW